MVGLQRSQIDGFVVGGALLPAAKQDANPFEGEGANGGMMFLPSRCSS